MLTTILVSLFAVLIVRALFTHNYLALVLGVMGVFAMLKALVGM